MVSQTNPKHRLAPVTSPGHSSKHERPTNPGQSCKKGTVHLAQRDTEQSFCKKTPAVAKPATHRTLCTAPSCISGSRPQLFTAGVRDHQPEQGYFAALFSPTGKGQSQLHHSLTSVLQLLHPDSGGLLYPGTSVSHNTGCTAGGHGWEVDT